MKKTMSFTLCAGMAAALGMACGNARAQLPPDFPPITIVSNGVPDPGYLFGSLNVSNMAGYSNYFAILNNDSSPILLNKTNSLGLLTCSGLFVTSQGSKGQPFTYYSKDSAFNVIAVNQAGNGYSAERDMRVMPNGHCLFTIVDNLIMDLSKTIPGAGTAVKVSGNVIQEIDVDNNVVFQWRIEDHVPITDSYQDLMNPGSYAHVNSVWFDDLDGTIIISCRNTSQVLKINRTTGEIIWRLGGKQNEFTFTNAIPEGLPGHGDPAEFAVQHSVKRLPNGNLTVFDNGYSDHSDPQYHFDRPYSRAAEYEIDEVHKVAKLVWQCRHTPDIITYNGGDVLRLAGGHTIINWAAENTANPRLAMTEANEEGFVVTDVQLPVVTNASGVVTGQVSGSFTRNVWPLESTYVNVTKRELAEGNTYDFSEGTTNTGLSLTVETLDGDQYNSVTVSRQPFAPVLPHFVSKAPGVVPVRVQLTQNLINGLVGTLAFDVTSFGLKDPTNTTVYYRETPGQGIFAPVQDTEYNWVTHKLQASFSGFGEYILGFPDAPEIPFAPLLITPQQGTTVNQNLPVSFFWTPNGFATSYHLQVSTNADFANLVLDRDNLSETLYTNMNVAAGTTYYWRVNTLNHGGVSDWATNTFTSVPPMVQVVSPNGGEALQRGVTSTIQWNANVAEKIALDLYKAGVLVRTLATNNVTPSTYKWNISVTLTPGSDYSLRIRSATNSALYDFSDANFSIVDIPAIDSSSVILRPDGSVQFGLTAPGAATATVLCSTNLSAWNVLQTVPVTSGAAVFIDNTASNSPSRFYCIRVP